MGIEPTTSRVENPIQSHRGAHLAWSGFDAITETTQLANHVGGTTLCLLATDGGTALLVTDGLMENHPDQTT